MFIDGICTSVGSVYADYMRRSLSVWATTLDSLTIVTMPADPVIEVCRPYSRVRVIQTDLFKQHGAAFNKGAALSHGYAIMDPLDAVLHFDADIHPPANWREIALAEFKPGCIHGCVRHDEQGQQITDLGDWPYGYFQLWCADDRLAQFWPLFEVWHHSAGGYDLEFLEHWPTHLRKKLSFDVLHYGEVRRNWFGVGLEERAQRESFARMDRVHKVGLRKTRIQTREPQHRLKVPDFALRLSIDPDPARPDRVHRILRACMTDDPFLVEASMTAPNALPSVRLRTARHARSRKLPVGVKQVKHSMQPEVVRNFVEAAYLARHGRRP